MHDRQLVQTALETPPPVNSENEQELSSWLQLARDSLNVLLENSKENSDAIEALEIVRAIARLQETNPVKVEEDFGAPSLFEILKQLRQAKDMNLASVSRTVFARQCDLDTPVDNDPRQEIRSVRQEAWTDRRHWLSGVQFENCSSLITPLSRKRTRSEGSDDSDDE